MRRPERCASRRFTTPGRRRPRAAQRPKQRSRSGLRPLRRLDRSANQSRIVDNGGQSPSRRAWHPHTSQRHTSAPPRAARKPDHPQGPSDRAGAHYRTPGLTRDFGVVAATEVSAMKRQYRIPPRRRPSDAYPSQRTNWPALRGQVVLTPHGPGAMTTPSREIRCWGQGGMPGDDRRL
jgi:hypothetical protein